MTSRSAIVAMCDRIETMLLEKNERYGDSALEPVRIFSKASPVEQILVRLDDKLSRLRTMGVGAAEDEDTLLDFVGYLILLLIVRSKAGASPRLMDGGRANVSLSATAERGA